MSFAQTKSSYIKCGMCGNVTSTTGFGVCPACIAEDQRLYEIARSVMKPNQNMNFTELCEKTGIDVKVIQRWVTTGRLRGAA